MTGRNIPNSIKYLFVGGSSALLELILFRLIVSAGTVTLALANVAAVVTATTYNYVLNKRWSFNSRKWSMRSLLLYLLLFAFNTTFSSIFITATSEIGLPPTCAKLISMSCIIIWNYYLYRNVVFK